MIYSRLLYKLGGGLSDVTLYLGPENTLSCSLSCRAVSREQASPATTTESGESGEPGEQLDSGDTGQSSPGINDFHHTMAPYPLFSKKNGKITKYRGTPAQFFFRKRPGANT